MNCHLCGPTVDEHAHCSECEAILDDPTGFCPNERALARPMPVADALADAETLRMSQSCWVDVWTAQEYGRHARRYIAQDESVACGAARNAAHAAFRAVPELRG